MAEVFGFEWLREALSVARHVDDASSFAVGMVLGLVFGHLMTWQTSRLVVKQLRVSLENERAYASTLREQLTKQEKRIFQLHEQLLKQSGGKKRCN